MSKRTWRFSRVGGVRNSGRAAFGLSPARVEQRAAGLRAPGRDLQGVQIGMRHSF
jgi:hypothetical protein